MVILRSRFVPPLEWTWDQLGVILVGRYVRNRLGGTVLVSVADLLVIMAGHGVPDGATLKRAAHGRGAWSVQEVFASAVEQREAPVRRLIRGVTWRISPKGHIHG